MSGNGIGSEGVERGARQWEKKQRSFWRGEELVSIVGEQRAGYLTTLMGARSRRERDFCRHLGTALCYSDFAGFME
ncbi:hypothetical protein KFK09_017958 [Dendrobium nobile]|uniref:Uncharacterized protein n=1 Tax=Dendrobium nobile TaxID=94219 RepID=A0A8T3AUE1_DENNO|nr:hypothetical protein KFK09_017958 [Dendrobium nobile]